MPQTVGYGARNSPIGSGQGPGDFGHFFGRGWGRDLAEKWSKLREIGSGPFLSI